MSLSDAELNSDNLLRMADAVTSVMALHSTSATVSTENSYVTAFNYANIKAQMFTLLPSLEHPEAWLPCITNLVNDVVKDFTTRKFDNYLIKQFSLDKISEDALSGDLTLNPVEFFQSAIKNAVSEYVSEYVRGWAETHPDSIIADLFKDGKYTGVFGQISNVIINDLIAPGQNFLLAPSNDGTRTELTVSLNVPQLMNGLESLSERITAATDFLGIEFFKDLASSFKNSITAENVGRLLTMTNILDGGSKGAFDYFSGILEDRGLSQTQHIFITGVGYGGLIAQDIAHYYKDADFNVHGYVFNTAGDGFNSLTFILKLAAKSYFSNFGIALATDSVKYLLKNSVDIIAADISDAYDSAVKMFENNEVRQELYKLFGNNIDPISSGLINVNLTASAGFSTWGFNQPYTVFLPGTASQVVIGGEQDIRSSHEVGFQIKQTLSAILHIAEHNGVTVEEALRLYQLYIDRVDPYNAQHSVLQAGVDLSKIETGVPSLYADEAVKRPFINGMLQNMQTADGANLRSIVISGDLSNTSSNVEFSDYTPDYWEAKIEALMARAVNVAQTTHGLSLEAYKVLFNLTAMIIHPDSTTALAADQIKEAVLAEVKSSIARLGTLTTGYSDVQDLSTGFTYHNDLSVRPSVLFISNNGAEGHTTEHMGKSGDDKFVGGSANDHFSGGAGNDIFSGGGGNDILDGGLGADRYRFYKGHGNDIILGETVPDENQPDTIELVNVRIWGMKLDGRDLLISTGEDSSIRIKDYFTVYDEATGRYVGNVEKIQYVGSDITYSLNQQFANQLGVSDVEVVNKYSTDEHQSRSKAGSIHYIFGDNVVGGEGDDIIQGSNEPSTLVARGGSDVLKGEAGNDILSSVDHYDQATFIGGKGYDRLFGGSGKDVYQYATGDGGDLIADAGGEGRLELKLDGEMSFKYDGENLVLFENDRPIIQITGWYDANAYGAFSIIVNNGTPLTYSDINEQLRFIYGTVHDDSIFDYKNPSNFSNTIFGLEGADVINGIAGGKGTTTVIAGTGDDLVNASDSIGVIKGDAGDDKIVGGAYTHYMEGGSGVDILDGSLATEGVTLIDGDAGDTLIGSKQSDTTFVHSGNNTIGIELNSDLVNNVLLLNGGAIDPSKVGLSYQNAVLTVSDLGSGATLAVIQDWSYATNFVIKGHSSSLSDWTLDRQGLINQLIRQAMSNDNNVLDLPKINVRLDINALGGDDRITTQSEGVLDGGSGNDTLTSITYGPIIYGRSGNDTMYLEGEIAIANGGEGDDTITTKAKNATIYGSSGNDSINVFGATSAYVSGDAGNDYIVGNDGTTRYQFSKGDGFDTIVDYGGIDTLQLGGGLGIPAYSVQGNDLLLTFNSTDKILLKDYCIGNGAKLEFIEINGVTTALQPKLDEVLNKITTDMAIENSQSSASSQAVINNISRAPYVFVDNSAKSAGVIQDYSTSNTAVVVQGSAYRDQITGSTKYSNVVNLGAGDDAYTGSANQKDIVFGEAGNDTIIGTGSLYGGSGNDALTALGASYLNGGDGSDTLRGSKGADTLVGGSGNDTLDDSADIIGGNIYDTGAGNDTVTGSSGRDTYIYGGGIDTYTCSLNANLDTVIADSSLKLGTPSFSMYVPAAGYSPVLVATFDDNNKINFNGWFSSANRQFGSVFGVSAADIETQLVNRETGNANDTLNLNSLVLIQNPTQTINVDLGGGSDTYSGSQLTYRQNISGGAGNDAISVGSNAGNIVHGGDGADTLSGNGALYGDAGNDTLNTGAYTNAQLYGGEGNDRLSGMGRMEGGAGDDEINVTGSTAVTTIVHKAGDGFDYVSGYFNNVQLELEGAYRFELAPASRPSPLGIGWLDRGFILRSETNVNDAIEFSQASTYGKTGDELLAGRTIRSIEKEIFTHESKVFSETVDFSKFWGYHPRFIEHSDIKFLGGTNVFKGNGFADHVQGGTGTDYLDGGTGYNIIHGGYGDDTLSGYGELYGDEGNDSIEVMPNVKAYGGEGNDRFNAYGGTVSGGEGVDTVYVQNSSVTVLDAEFVLGSRGVNLNLAGSSAFHFKEYVAQGYSQLTWTTRNIEYVDIVFEDSGITVQHWKEDGGTQYGSINGMSVDYLNMAYAVQKNTNAVWASGSFINGSANNDVLHGAATLHGLAGDDTLQGSNLTFDKLYGDAGNDILRDDARLFAAANAEIKGAEFHGGAGDDTLYLNPLAADKVYYEIGDGQDIIKASIGANQDEVILTANNLSNISFTTKYRQDETGLHTDLVMHAAADSSVTFENWFDDSRYQFKSIGGFSAGQINNLTQMAEYVYTANNATIYMDTIPVNSTRQSVMMYGENGTLYTDNASYIKSGNNSVTIHASYINNTGAQDHNGNFLENVILTGNGNDSIYSAGIINAGRGDDRIVSYCGSRVVFETGSGHDTLTILDRPGFGIVDVQWDTVRAVQVENGSDATIRITNGEDVLDLTTRAMDVRISHKGVWHSVSEYVVPPSALDNNAPAGFKLTAETIPLDYAESTGIGPLSTNNTTISTPYTSNHQAISMGDLLVDNSSSTTLLGHLEPLTTSASSNASAPALASTATTNSADSAFLAGFMIINPNPEYKPDQLLMV